MNTQERIDASAAFVSAVADIHERLQAAWTSWEAGEIDLEELERIISHIRNNTFAELMREE